MYTPAQQYVPDMVAAPGMQEQMPIKQPEVKEEKAKKDSKTSVDSFIKSLISLSAYLHEMQMQAHLIHLNYEGSSFLAVHKFLKKRYLAHQEQFDQLAEFVRSMDYLMPMCHKGLMNAYPKFKHVKTYDGKQMLLTYLENLEELGMMSKKYEAAAAKIKAIDIQNYMAELCGDAFKYAWMIKAMLRNCQ